VSPDAHPDDELIRELHDVLERADPVPAEVTEFAKAALGWRRLDVEFAELLDDSALDERSAMLSRSGESGSRWLSFRSSELSLDVEVVSNGTRRLLRGQLAPPTEATVDAQGSDGTTIATADADPLGRFRITLETGARIRLRLTPLDRSLPVLETSWVAL
jgi:hypothetical protein